MGQVTNQNAAFNTKSKARACMPLWEANCLPFPASFFFFTVLEKGVVQLITKEEDTVCCRAHSKAARNVCVINFTDQSVE